MDVGAFESWDRVREGAGALGLRDAVRRVRAAFVEHDLVLKASAIAFRVFLALIPCILFVVGLLGFLDLEEVWRDDIAPDLRDGVSTPAFKLIDDAVTHVLTHQQLFWVTAGALLATWQLSSVVRGVGKILNRVYGDDADSRPFSERISVSYAVAAAVGLLVLAAVAVVRLGAVGLDHVLGAGPVAELVSFVVRWSLAVVLLLGAIGLTVRAGPERRRPFHWVTFGALLVVAGWLAMSGLFGLYLTQIADYGSIFGNLATTFILLEYLHLSAIVLIGGLVLDRIVQEEA
jgi:membrane protein